MEYVNKVKTGLANTWFGLMSPLRALAEREGVAPNRDMRMTRLVERVIGVGREQE